MEGVDGNDWVNIEVPSLLVRTNCWVDGVQAPPAPAMMDAGTEYHYERCLWPSTCSPQLSINLCQRPICHVYRLYYSCALPIACEVARIRDSPTSSAATLGQFDPARTHFVSLLCVWSSIRASTMEVNEVLLDLIKGFVWPLYRSGSLTINRSLSWARGYDVGDAKGTNREINGVVI